MFSAKTSSPPFTTQHENQIVSPIATVSGIEIPCEPKLVIIELFCDLTFKEKTEINNNIMRAFVFTLQVYEQINQTIHFL